MRMRLVHGFTQTSRSWGRVEALLPHDWDVQAFDVPDGLDFVATAHALGARAGNGSWVGYSMGARLGLRLALDRPELVDRLALISGTPGMRSATERSTRRADDERLAQQVERTGVAAFIDRWLDQRLFEALSRDAAMVDDRVRGNSVQRITHQLRVLGQGAHEPMWDQLSSLEMPVLVVSGAYDRTYTEVAEAMVAAIGANAHHEVVDRAGHAAHLERPETVAQLLASW